MESLSPAVRALDRIVAEIAPTEIPVLIVGESGTGKEVMARRVHELSAHRSAAFVKLVCSTLAPDALDRLLVRDHLDHDRGQGLSNVGTLFLDEIDELDPACQPKLLHALPDGGAMATECCLRARVISSSRRNLEDEIRSGRFREDLHYRLNDVCLRLPPLRHRKDDIPGLVEFFLGKYAVQFGRSKPSLSSGALRRLADYSWPGNIRQLENAVKKIVALGDERLALADLESVTSEPPQSSNDGSKQPSLKEAARAASHQAERELILKALDRTRWNRKRAAKELQISYKAFLYKLKQIGLEDSTGSSGGPRERG